MSDFFALELLRQQAMTAERELRACNEMSVLYGLFLSEEQIRGLVERRFGALRDNGRIEFGEGVLPKLVYAFCDSPYITQENYGETLLELQDAFYFFKNESVDRLSDDELIGYMKSTFDGRAEGSMDYLAGTSLEELCRYAREGYDPLNGNGAGDLF
jgi:hypothetical protein